MNKQKKFLMTILFFLTIILSNYQVFAVNITEYIGKMQFSEDYSNYLKLSDEEKKDVIAPRMYDISKNKMKISNPFKLAKMLRSTTSSKYSLQTVIPKNMVVKNQEQTNTCWTFASLASLESNLALKDYNNGLIGENAIVYDFSERHMEYATSKTFANNQINQIGFNRQIGDGGNSYIYIPYLINGTGPIAEEDFPFENNQNLINISAIQNKKVVAEINDIVNFPSYSSTDDKTKIKQQMKEHIMNHGAIDAGIYGASISSNSSVYNSETGAIYCSNNILYPINHAVAIVGWNDNYSTNNFVRGNQPSTPGAWIIKNSWGTGERYTLEEMKQYIFTNFPDDCANAGWKSASEIPDETAIHNFTNWGFTIDENKDAILKVGDNGFMYVSYEDANIYKQLNAIENAQNEVTYENIYQYDQYGGVIPFLFTVPKVFLATEFDRKTSGVEYLTQVSITASETYTCKVYVNPNGTSKSIIDLQQVKLKAGESETFDAGYHTLEFLEPIKINSDKFVVVLEIQGTQEDEMSVMMEFNYGDFVGDDGSIGYIYNNVTVETGKCFWTVEDDITANKWYDTSATTTLTQGGWPNFDTTIKAFTTSNVLETIKVTIPPNKTSYFVGEDFDSTGMVVKANYGNGRAEEITNYTITDGVKLSKEQTSVTISYEGKTTTQSITVLENKIESIKVTTPSTKTEYWAGEDFDATGMVVTATYTDGTTKNITNYTIKDGQSLKNGQTTVTIEVEGKTATQAIIVKTNSVMKLEITQAPKKMKYVTGQNFNPEGMVVKATYKNEMEKEVTNYTIKDGEALKQDQKTVTIEFEGQTVTQTITVEAKTVIAISVKTMPTKTTYLQNKENLDLKGGSIEISYNDETKEEMVMTSEEITVLGFDNKEIGIQNIILTYQGKTTQFKVEIKEEPKPENSKIDNIKGNVTRVRAYYFTDNNKDDYTVINVEIGDISKSTVNDKVEYYYYLSSNQQESSVADWIKINELKETENGLSFEINTLEVSNYQELVNVENIYLYIKEVATRNDMKSEAVTKSILLQVENINIEEYVDGEKKAEVNSGTITDSTPGEEADDTLAPGTIPNAGKSILLLIVAVVILIIGRVSYLRYKDIILK